MTCPDENSFLRYAAGSLPEAGRADMDSHLDDCVACRKVFSSMALTGPQGGAVPASIASETPDVLDGRYRLGVPLGEGGTGQVFAAEHLRTGRRCAVKFLSDAAAADPEAVERFGREARILGGLEHRGIVSILDFAEAADGRPYLVMERLAGEDLAARLDREGALEWSEVSRIFRQLCRALQESHAHGVLHRDLKPSNIFLTPDSDGSERAVLLDFGLAKQNVLDEPALTRTGVIMGTPAYMSPEQARGRPVDERTDVYSLAAVLYQMVTGEAPFWGSTFTDVLAQVLADPPAKLAQGVSNGIPAHLDGVIQVAMAKEPGERHGSVAELEHRVLDESAPGLVPATDRRSSKALWLLLAGVAALLAIGLGVYRWQYTPRSKTAAHEAAGLAPMQPLALAPVPDAGAAHAAPTPVVDAGSPVRAVTPQPQSMHAARPMRSTPKRARPRPRQSGSTAAMRPRPRAAMVPLSHSKVPFALRKDPLISVRDKDGKPKMVRLSQLPPAHVAKLRITTYMGRRNWKACARTARKAPQTRMILYYSIFCHWMSGDRARTVKLCAQYKKRFPARYNSNASCRYATRGAPPPRLRP